MQRQHGAGNPNSVQVLCGHTNSTLGEGVSRAGMARTSQCTRASVDAGRSAPNWQAESLTSQH